MIISFTKSVRLQLFKATILPYLTYCHRTWHLISVRRVIRENSNSGEGLRVLFRDDKSTYEQLLNKAKSIALHERRLQDMACLMYKVKHGMCPQSVRDLFSENSPCYNLPRFHSVTYGKHSLRYLGPKLWNSLPSYQRNLPSLQSLKKQTRLVKLSFKFKSDFDRLWELRIM